MPSPIGHAIAGVTAGWLVAGAPSGAPDVAEAFAGKVPAAFWREAALFAALGALPDIDLLFGAHSGPTHSIGATLVVGIVAGLVQGVIARRSSATGRRSLTFALACLAAYGSHVLLDWLGTDASPPIGIMALWPFSHAYYESHLHFFMAISRRYYQGWTFVHHNALALFRELAILLPLLTMIGLLRSRLEPRR
jgi:membrane-bound metal-dependent hydrolase YbcI (DUF457 family)